MHHTESEGGRTNREEWKKCKKVGRTYFITNTVRSVAGEAEAIYDDETKHGATLVFRNGDAVSRGYYPCEMMKTKEQKSKQDEPDEKSIDWLLANGYIE